jgi:phage protein D
MSQYARKISIELTYEGKNISKNLSEDLVSFSYKDNLDSFDEISVTVFDKNDKWLKEWVSKKGDIVSAKLILNENNKDEIFFEPTVT